MRFEIVPEKIGKSGTLKQMIRLPSSIIDLLDQIIDEHKNYATKPDFIIYSVRSYLSVIIESISKIIESEISPQSTDKDLEKLKEVIDDPEMLNYVFTKNKIGFLAGLDDETIGKDTKPIMIYIPLGMVDEIDYIIEKTRIAKNLIDFIKQSISYNLAKQLYFNGIWDLMNYRDEHGKIDKKDMKHILFNVEKINTEVITDDLIYYFLKEKLKNFE